MCIWRFQKVTQETTDHKKGCVQEENTSVVKKGPPIGVYPQQLDGPSGSGTVGRIPTGLRFGVGIARTEERKPDSWRGAGRKIWVSFTTIRFKCGTRTTPRRSMACEVNLP